MGEWKSFQVGEIGKVITGKTPKTSISDNYGGYIPFLTPSDDMSVKYVRKTAKTLTEKGLSEVKNAILPANSVCVSCIGSDLGKVVITTRPTVTNQQINSIVVDEARFDISFVYYAMRILGKKLNFISKTSTAVPIVNKSSFSSYEIECPSLKEQKQIAAVLSVLDAKIECNRMINDNLQQQVQTLFADWLSANSESATKVALGDVCTKVTDGSHFSPKDDPTSSIPMLSVKDMREFDFDLTSCKHICEDDYEKMVANDCVPQINDILVAKDGSYLKEIFICNEQRKLAILSSIAIFRPNATAIHPEILLAFLKSPRVLREVRDNYVSGSALPRIVLKDFKKLTFALPNMDAQNLIAPLFASIREQIAVNVAENKYMAQLRDALLPKLMSGELSVDNIQL